MISGDAYFLKGGHVRGTGLPRKRGNADPVEIRSRRSAWPRVVSRRQRFHAAARFGHRLGKWEAIQPSIAEFYLRSINVTHPRGDPRDMVEVAWAKISIYFGFGPEVFSCVVEGSRGATVDLTFKASGLVAELVNCCVPINAN